MIAAEILGTANGNDIIIAGLVLVGVIITAFATLFSALQARGAKQAARNTEQEMKSPNGERTADSIYEMRKSMINLVATGAELKAHLRDIQLRQLEHTIAADERFSRLYDHLGLEKD